MFFYGKICENQRASVYNFMFTSDGDSGAVSVSARDGATAHDGSSLKYLVGQWDAWSTNSDSG